VAIGLFGMTASAQICVISRYGAAIYVAETEKSELTQKKAMTHGLARMFEDKKEDTRDLKNKKPAKARNAQAKQAERQD